MSGTAAAASTDSNVPRRVRRMGITFGPPDPGISTVTPPTPYSLDFPHGPKAFEVRCWGKNNHVTTVQIVSHDPAIPKSALIGEAHPDESTRQALTIDPNKDLVTGIKVVADEGGVMSFSLMLSNGKIKGPIGFELKSGHQASIQDLSKRPSALVIGLQGTREAGLVASIGLSFSEAGPIDLGELANDVDRKWVDDAADPSPDFQQDSSLAPSSGILGDQGAPNPNYITKNVFRVEQKGEDLTVFGMDGSIRQYRYSALNPIGVSGAFTSIYQSTEDASILEIDPHSAAGKIELSLFQDANSAVRSLTLFPAKPYDSPKSTDGHPVQSFGDTFNQDNEARFSEFCFRGYEISQIDPHNLQTTAGFRANVFAYPDRSSFDFHNAESGAKKFSPNGVAVFEARVTTELSRTKSIGSEKEHQEGTGQTIGFKAGIGEPDKDGLNFSVNSSNRQAIANTLKNSGGYTLSTGVFQTICQAVDLPRVKLDPAFRQAVEDLALRLQQNASPDFEGFINTFGTHFSYVTTFGGLTFAELIFSRRAASVAQEKSTSLETSAGIAFKGFNMGMSTTDTSEEKDVIAQEVESQRDAFVAIGGEASAGKGFTVGNADVPIMADMRPLLDLINPAFFDDPFVYTTLRDRLKQAYIDHAAKFPSPDANVAGPLSGPAMFQVEIGAFTPAAPGRDRFVAQTNMLIQPNANPDTDIVMPANPLIWDIEAVGNADPPGPPPLGRPVTFQVQELASKNRLLTISYILTEPQPIIDGFGVPVVDAGSDHDDISSFQIPLNRFKYADGKLDVNVNMHVRNAQDLKDTRPAGTHVFTFLFRNVGGPPNFSDV